MHERHTKEMARPMQTTGTKTCKTCGATKDIIDFYKRGGKYKWTKGNNLDW